MCVNRPSLHQSTGCACFEQERILTNESERMEGFKNNLSLVRAEARVAGQHEQLKLLGWNVAPEDLVQIPVNIKVKCKLRKIIHGFVHIRNIGCHSKNRKRLCTIFSLCFTLHLHSLH